VIWRKSINELDRETAEWLGGPVAAPLSGLSSDGEQFEIAEQLVSFTATASCASDEYRTLRHSVDRVRRDGGLRLLAVTSATQGDGKSTKALNLAATLAQTRRDRVLIVDADLRRPSVGRYLGLDPIGSRGLSGALLDASCDLAEATVRLDRFNLSVLPGGNPAIEPYELLNSSRFEALLADARRLYDCVVIDTPPLLPFPDSRLVTRWADGYLLVVAAHKTPRKLLSEAMGLLDQKKLIGVVFNGDDQPRSSHYGYYGYCAPAGPERSRGW
jgi:capsular exopolysaccharide synthesis family protein